MERVELEYVPPGDRECPDCQVDSLIEKGKEKWECVVCGKIYDDVWLDACEE